MSTCNLNYIPSRLHKNGRSPIDKFEVGEHLYFRCSNEEIENPYLNISIAELSHNRSGIKNDILCNPNDVLYIINDNSSREKYDDKVVCIIEIISLTHGNYEVIFEQVKNNIKHICKMKLVHEPEECMFPHSVFRIWLNDTLITKDDFKKTICKLDMIRSSLKNALATMIIQELLSD